MCSLAAALGHDVPHGKVNKHVVPHKPVAAGLLPICMKAGCVWHGGNKLELIEAKCIPNPY